MSGIGKKPEAGSSRTGSNRLSGISMRQGLKPDCGWRLLCVRKILKFIKNIPTGCSCTTGNPGKERGDDIVEGKKSLPVLIHAGLCPDDKPKIAEFMKAAAAGGIHSPAVEDCIALLNTSGCIQKAAERGRTLIEQSCAKFHSQQIQELFTSMIPENFR